MSAERMNYDDLKATLKSFGATDSEIYKIFQYLNGQGFCRIDAENVLIYIERVSAGHYDIALD